MTTLIIIATIFATLAGIFSWGFIIHYTITTSWWRTIVGTQLFISSLSMAILMTLILVAKYIGVFPGYVVFAFSVYVLIAIAKGLLWFIFIRTRKTTKRKNAALRAKALEEEHA